MWNPPIRERGQGGVFSAKDPPKKARKKRKRLDEADALPCFKGGVFLRRCTVIPTNF